MSNQIHFKTNCTDPVHFGSVQNGSVFHVAQNIHMQRDLKEINQKTSLIYLFLIYSFTFYWGKL